MRGGGDDFYKLFKCRLCMYVSLCFANSSCICLCMCVCICTISRASGVIIHYPTRDQCLALSSTRVLLFNVINVMYAWFHMRFISSSVLTIEHHQCLPAMSQLFLMTPAF